MWKCEVRKKCLFQWESNSRKSVPAKKPSHPPQSRAMGSAAGRGELSVVMLNCPTQLWCLFLLSLQRGFFFPFLFAFASPLRRTYISHQHADSCWRLIRFFPASIHQVSIRIIPALTPCSATSFPTRLPPGRFSTTLYHHCLIQFSQWFHSDEKCLISHLPTARHQGPPPPTFTTFWASSLGLSHIFNNDKLSYLKWKPSLSYIFIDANPGR